MCRTKPQSWSVAPAAPPPGRVAVFPLALIPSRVSPAEEETSMNVMAKRAAPVRPDLDPELNNLAMSKEAQPLFDAVMAHIAENVAPISDEFFRLGEGRKDNWSWAPGQLELLEVAKSKAKA